MIGWHFLKNNKGTMLPSKWEILGLCSTKLTHFCKKPLLALDCRQSKYYLLIYNIYVFSIFGVAFSFPFLYYFQKLQLLVVKNFWNNFCCIVFLFTRAQKVCLRFQTVHSNIFVHCGVFFSRYVQLNSSFSNEKNISSEIWWTL